MNQDVMSTVFIAADVKANTVLTDVKASLRRAKSAPLHCYMAVI